MAILRPANILRFSPPVKRIPTPSRWTLLRAGHISGEPVSLDFRWRAEVKRNRMLVARNDSALRQGVTRRGGKSDSDWARPAWNYAYMHNAASNRVRSDNAEGLFSAVALAATVIFWL